MTTPAPDPLAVDDDLVDRLRKLVRAEDATNHPTAEIVDYLERAKLDVDRRVGGATVQAHVVRSWYLAVAAELFDRDKAPSPNIPDRFGGDGAVLRQRATRNPLQVVEREIRLWVPTW
ncbi:hypothetical protein [Rhodococcus pyridinivorans]|nr:hypothetical protein [Rhodococcus pyridinivorans]MCD2142344.1 hypothetical protein [Rhodococcus pyridinivorans]